jgi:hypothetical protein
MDGRFDKLKALSLPQGIYRMEEWAMRRWVKVRHLLPISIS